MKLYHVAKPDYTRTGPHDETTLQTMLNNGQLTADCLVWTEGWPDWQPITTVVTPPLSDTQTAWGLKAAVMSALINRYSTYTGRASRSEFWWFILAQVLYFISIIIGFIAFCCLSETSSEIDTWTTIVWLLGALLLGISVPALIIPNIAVSVRRLHDAGFSGRFFLLIFLPAGFIILFIFMLLPSDQPNQWGVRADSPAE